MEDDKLIAICEKVSTGHHGPYVVTREQSLGVITLSLAAEHWPENRDPEPGTILVLTGVFKKKAGWRANHGRFYRPSDQQSTGGKK